MTTPDEIAEAADRKLATDRHERVEKVKRIAHTEIELREARERTRELEKQHAREWRDATKAGWTDADLRGFGLDAPDRRASGRPRATGASSSN
jgi:hypothetical protein